MVASSALGASRADFKPSHSEKPCHLFGAPVLEPTNLQRSSHSQVAVAMAAIDQRIASVVQLPGNRRCFDCDAPLAVALSIIILFRPRLSTQMRHGSKSGLPRCSALDPWVSLSHGSVICINCAGRHRSFGVHVLLGAAFLRLTRM